MKFENCKLTHREDGRITVHSDNNRICELQPVLYFVSSLKVEAMSLQYIYENDEQKKTIIGHAAFEGINIFSIGTATKKLQTTYHKDFSINISISDSTFAAFIDGANVYIKLKKEVFEDYLSMIDSDNEMILIIRPKLIEKHLTDVNFPYLMDFSDYNVKGVPEGDSFAFFSDSMLPFEPKIIAQRRI